jgi:hypothetical protein
MSPHLDWERFRPAAASSKIEVFAEMARNLVGDNGSPNLYFVSDRSGVFLITSDFDVAHEIWKSLPTDQETTLEDRKTGVLASTEPESNERGARLVTYDVAPGFRYRLSQRRRPEVHVRGHPRRQR